jgi:predicted amidohydrolase YtcJ
MRSLSTLCVAALAPALLSAQAPADLVLTGGRIYTLDGARPVVSALAVRNGRVAFIGSDGEALLAGGPLARVIDLQGKTVVPGLIDAHAHLLSLGNSLRRVSLSGAKSYDEVIARVVAWSKDALPGEWIRGRGWDQVDVHAIGDRGNRIVLDAFEAALRAVPVVDHRFRIEHAQVLSPQDIPRFARLGAIPSMQATHQTSDMRWAESRVGPERIRGAYAWRSLLDTGVVIANGTDFPVEGSGIPSSG